MYSTTDIMWKCEYVSPREKSVPPDVVRISSEGKQRGDTKYEWFLSPPEADIKPWLVWSLSIDTINTAISPTAL
jgi:hypothetical protein